MKNSIKIFLLTSSLGILVFAGLLLAGQVIQTQECDLYDGLEVDLTRLDVRNNIITVRFKLRNTGEDSHRVQIYYKDCYIMDEANQKKYFVLKDSDGQYIAGPKEKDWDGGRFLFSIEPGKSKSMWMKFPAPTDNPETIAISIPGVFPFEEVPLI